MSQVAAEAVEVGDTGAASEPVEPTTKPEAKTPWQNIPIKDIEYNERDRLRRVNDDAVAEKVESIREIGLLHPITVTVRHVTRGGHTTYRLRAGLHRLEAYKRLKWKTIPAHISPLTGRLADLIEVDENLMQTKLSREQRIRFTAKRKEIYEALHPETAKGAAQGEGKKRSLADKGTDGKVCRETDNQAPASFVADTAAKTGRSERSIRLDAELGTKIAPDVLEAIEGTALSTGQTYHELKDLSHEEQRDRIKEMEAQASEPKVRQPAIQLSPEEKHACEEHLDVSFVAQEIVSLCRRINYYAEKQREAAIHEILKKEELDLLEDAGGYLIGIVDWPESHEPASHEALTANNVSEH